MTSARHGHSTKPVFDDVKTTGFNTENDTYLIDSSSYFIATATVVEGFNRELETHTDRDQWSTKYQDGQ